MCRRARCPRFWLPGILALHWTRPVSRRGRRRCGVGLLHATGRSPRGTHVCAVVTVRVLARRSGRGRRGRRRGRGRGRRCRCRRRSSRVQHSQVELLAAQQRSRRSCRVRTERRARLGENQYSATCGDRELMEPVCTRRPAARQRGGGQDAYSWIVAELPAQGGSRLLRAAVVEHDDVQVVDPALTQRGAHGGDRRVGPMTHRDEYRDRFRGLGRARRGAVQVKRCGIDADLAASPRVVPQRGCGARRGAGQAGYHGGRGGQPDPESECRQRPRRRGMRRRRPGGGFEC